MEKIKTIKNENVKIIEEIAQRFALLRRGANEAIKTHAEKFLDLCSDYSNIAKTELKKNKKYTVITTSMENLGTKKWANWYRNYNILDIEVIGETDCYYITKIENEERKIKKDKIAYVIV